MKIELLTPDNSSFKQVKANESFLFGGEPFLRIKHSEGALMALCNKKSVTVARSGFALNLKMGLFKKAQDELKLASDQNTAQLKEAQQTIDDCTAEQARIDNASKFLDNILNGGDKVETVKA